VPLDYSITLSYSRKSTQKTANRQSQKPSSEHLMTSFLTNNFTNSASDKNKTLKSNLIKTNQVLIHDDDFQSLSSIKKDSPQNKLKLLEKNLKDCQISRTSSYNSRQLLIFQHKINSKDSGDTNLNTSNDKSKLVSF